MAIWQHDLTDERFDDGEQASPGEPDFSRDLAEAHYQEPKFSYFGTPDWTPDAE